MGLRDFTSALEEAAEDENVEGLYLNVESVAAATSTMADLRDALEAFKSSGKWVVGWAESMSMGALYLLQQPMSCTCTPTVEQTSPVCSCRPPITRHA